MGISRGDFIKGKGTGDFKDDVSSGEMHSLKAQNNLSPCFACQKKGANSGSTWGWLLREGVKNSVNRYLE